MEPVPAERDAVRRLDAWLHAAAAQATSGISPVALGVAYADWVLHLATQPAAATHLALQAAVGASQAWWATRPEAAQPAVDPRFSHPGWSRWPLAPLVRMHHAAQSWWDQATRQRGMSRHHQEVLRFHARQCLDMLSPSNVPMLNPQVLERSLERSGANLIDGLRNLHDDWRRGHGLQPERLPASQYRPGTEVAVTPGKVVHRNHLVELIQYLPLTASVQAEPVFIVPSWIMKYYILDLSPHNSLVKWLVSQGHTVFIVSWRNPDESDARLTFDDYLELGVFDALAAVARLVPGEAVHACGYCLGGTLLSIAAAALGRQGGVQQAAQLPRLTSLTLLAAETDFTEPGEMGVMIDEAQVALLEDMMAERGYLAGQQMAGSFTYLHSRDLVWSHWLHRFWLGEQDQPNDLMAWNADVTRMPAAMHSQYLRRCYLHNDLAEGRYPVQGEPVALGDIRQPMFVVGTETDHVSPWMSVYKIHRLCDTEICFVLTSGGHNAGIVSEPGHERRHFAMKTRERGGLSKPAQQWRAGAPRVEGSWWTAWHHWLARQGSGRSVKARTPPPATVLQDAPGSYVHVCYREA